MFITSQQLNLDSRSPFVVTDSTHRHMGDLSQAQNVLGKPLSRLKIPKFVFCFIPGQKQTSQFSSPEILLKLFQLILFPKLQITNLTKFAGKANCLSVIIKFYNPVPTLQILYSHSERNVYPQTMTSSISS